MASIYDVITADHETARRMLQELSATADDAGERRDELFPRFKNELLMHQHVEEAVFYAYLREREETRPDALEAINEHHVVDRLLEELDAMPKGNDEWTAKFGVLRELVEHHMEEEEGEFFERARQALDDGLARKMAGQFRDKKAAGLVALTPVDQAS